MHTNMKILGEKQQAIIYKEKLSSEIFFSEAEKKLSNQSVSNFDKTEEKTEKQEIFRKKHQIYSW